MPSALELVAGRVTAPGATLTALTPNSGQSFVVRNAPLDQRPLLIGAWAFNNADGVLRIRSPRLHDAQQGIRISVPANSVQYLWPLGCVQALYPQDTLIVELSGSSTAGQIETAGLLVYYPNLPGADARLADPRDVMRRSRNVVGIQVTITAGTTGDWSGLKSLGADFPGHLKANTDYAVLGYTTNRRGLAVALSGVDFGNVRVGGPLEPNYNDFTAWFFVELSDYLGLPLVPVFNSANIGGINVEVATNQDGGTYVITFFLYELG